MVHLDPICVTEGVEHRPLGAATYHCLHLNVGLRVDTQRSSVVLWINSRDICFLVGLPNFTCLLFPQTYSVCSVVEMGEGGPA